MKKFLSLIGALLLWQTMAVAQNYLHIWSGDSTKIVRMADLDSVTVRDASFYRFMNLDGSNYTASLVDLFDRPYEMSVTLAQPNSKTVQICDLDPYFALNGYTASYGTNILTGELTVAPDNSYATITCKPGQAMGYGDCVFVNIEDESLPIVFTLTETTLTCETGYGVYTASQGGYYGAFGPFVLYLSETTRAAAMRAARGNNLKEVKFDASGKLLLRNIQKAPRKYMKATPQVLDNNPDPADVMQLQPVAPREITE